MNVLPPHEEISVTDIIEARFEALDERFRSCGGEDVNFTGARYPG